MSLPGVVPQEYHCPWWICDYSVSQVNDKTLRLAAADAMQFGHALDCILQEIRLENPAYDPVLMSKYDISDGFYRVDLHVEDIPKLGAAFPARPRQGPSLL